MKQNDKKKRRGSGINKRNPADSTTRNIKAAAKRNLLLLERIRVLEQRANAAAIDLQELFGRVTQLEIRR